MRFLAIGLIFAVSAQLSAEEQPQIAKHFSIDTNEIPWVLVPIDELDHKLPLKPLFEDPRSGASATKIKYHAGFTNTWHTHGTGHGMYILDGILKTHKGDFGPGEFVWFPEGERMFHGASEENDVTFIFVTNEHFDISYE